MNETTEKEYSYHDVVVYVGEKEYKITNDYGLLLHCTRVGGWSLWNIWEDREEMIGSEYGEEPFCISVGGIAICGKLPDKIRSAGVVGWGGRLVR